MARFSFKAHEVTSKKFEAFGDPERADELVADGGIVARIARAAAWPLYPIAALVEAALRWTRAARAMFQEGR